MMHVLDKELSMYTMFTSKYLMWLDVMRVSHSRHHCKSPAEGQS